MTVGYNAWCTPGMGVSQWGASPLWECHRHGKEYGVNHELKARARPRGRVRRKPEADLRADEQKRHRRLSPPRFSPHLAAHKLDHPAILVKSTRAAERVMASLKRHLAVELRLTVNEQKSCVAPTNECVFLGFTFRGSKLRWSDRAFADFRYRLKGLTGRQLGNLDARAAPRLGRYLQGWMGCFGISEYYRPVPDLDSWLRRRVRMCYWKQWRQCRTRIRNLIALGTSRRQAILTGLSRKGPWRLAKTMATQTGMTNQWLAKQRLVSIRDRWIKAHGYA